MSARPKHLSKTYARRQYGRVVIGDVLYSKGGSVGPRRQNDYQLVVIHSGSLTLLLDDDALEVPENHAILLSPGHREHFSFARDRETRHSWIALRADALSENLRVDFARFRGPFPFLGRMASLLDIARQGLAPVAGADALHNRIYEELGTAILCAFACAVSDGHKSAETSESVLWRMDRFIAENYAQPLTLNQIARSWCLSPTSAEAVPSLQQGNADGAALRQAAGGRVGPAAPYRLLDRGDRRAVGLP
jgi:AraC family transcriptional regulator, arabinose operon regulatory protein